MAELANTQASAPDPAAAPPADPAAATTPPSDPPEPKTPLAAEPKALTQEDIDNAIAKARKAWEAEQDQAARLAKLSKEEREKEQLRLDKEAFEAERAALAREKLEIETAKQLSGKNLSPEFAPILCGKDAEETKANIEAFEAAFNAAVEAAVTDRMKGTPPKTGTPAQAKSLDEMTYTELEEYYRTHPEG